MPPADESETRDDVRRVSASDSAYWHDSRPQWHYFIHMSTLKIRLSWNICHEHTSNCAAPSNIPIVDLDLASLHGGQRWPRLYLLEVQKMERGCHLVLVHLRFKSVQSKQRFEQPSVYVDVSRPISIQAWEGSGLDNLEEIYRVSCRRR
jgi:hypothetical protein